MTKFKRGTYKVQCDLTGGIVRSDGCKTQWDQSYVNANYYRPKQPQDYIIVPAELAYPAHARASDDMAVPIGAEFNTAFNTSYDSLNLAGRGIVPFQSS